MSISVKEIKDFYWNKWNKLKENYYPSMTAWEVMDRIAQFTDDTVNLIIDNIEEPVDKFAIIALGGYARKQMAPYSDIDILILHHGKLTESQENFVNKFITNIWDANLHPGIQFKELEELEKSALEDDVVRTSFIDNRLVAGNKSLYIEFQNILYNKILTRGKNQYLMDKISDVRKRGKKFRDSIYRLEPNIKEGRGGIRDINSIYWICSILYNTDNIGVLVKNNIISIDDYDRLMKKSEIMFSIRNHLHYFHNRLYNVLNMEAQKHLAQKLGYVNTSDTLAVELFMKDYYKSARRITEITNKVINKTMTELILKKTQKGFKIVNLGNGFYQYGNQLTVRKDAFDNKPENILRVFEISAIKGLKLSESTLEIIYENLYQLTPDFIKKTGYKFIKLIGSFPNSSKIVTKMLIARVLTKYIPEFADIICKYQFDFYHHYTVDEHTILALKFIDNLKLPQPPQFQSYQDVLKKIERKDLLALSILLHDIGKGQGKNHSVVGAKMSKIICKRLGLKMDDIDTVSNLVEHHLLMSHISQRRDLHDVDVINHFTGFLNSAEELRLLYLLTYCDMSAVGGKIFNQWRNSLLTELYEKSEIAFEKDDLTVEFNKVVARKKQKLSDRVKDNPEIKQLTEFLDDEYIFSNKVSHIIRHLNMVTRISDENDIIMESDVKEKFNCLEFTICTYDQVGLLKKLSGAFAALGLNILGAQINTLRNGIAIDILQVQSPDDNLEKMADKLPRYLEKLHQLLKEPEQIESLIGESVKGFIEKKSIVPINNKIIIDNEVSSQFTVIDVYTEDKIGLLYNLLSKLEKIGLNVQKAKISTDVDRVVDSFYVTDLNYKKITDENFLENIKETILKELNNLRVDT